MPGTWKDAEFEKLGRFSTVFPADAIEKIDGIFERWKKNKTMLPHKEILAALEPHREELLKKGLVAEYAAYAIEFAFEGAVS